MQRLRHGRQLSISAFVGLALLGCGTSTTSTHTYPSTITLTGAVNTVANVSNNKISCEPYYEHPRILVQIATGSTLYWMSIVKAAPGAIGISLQNDDPKILKAWSGDGSQGVGLTSGVSHFDAESGASVNSSLIPASGPGGATNAATKPVHIQGTIVCPKPGTPSNLSVSGGLSGQMMISHVNCDNVAHSTGSRGIDAAGQINGTNYSVELISQAGQIHISVSPISPVTNVLWVGEATPSSTMDVNSGATVTGDLLSTSGRGSGGPSASASSAPASAPSAPHIHIQGVLTCPA